jgi:predicted DNA-binding transcriptional regulator AlpA
MFDDDKLYLAGHQALLVLGRPSTLAHWRSEGRGPAYLKLGSRVAYRGSDLNAWLAARTVRPTDDQQAGT